MADKAVPELDMLIGYHLANDQGGVDWGTFSGTPVSYTHLDVYKRQV